VTSLARGISSAREIGLAKEVVLWTGIPLEHEAGLRLHGRDREGQAALDDEHLSTPFAAEEPRIVVVAEVFDPRVAAIAWAVDE